MKQLNKIIVASTAVAIASQVGIGILGTDFRVSAGIIVLAIFLFYYRDLKPVPMALISGMAVYMLRVLIYFLGKGNLREIALSYQIEVLFYTFYGIVYSLIIRKSNRENINHLLLVLIVSDLSANLIEIYARIILDGSRFEWRIIVTLLFVAIVRSSIVWLVLNGLKYYKMLLIREEHEKRYTKLLWLTAQLKTEMYWMEKNMDNIEKVMSSSYALFEKVNHKEEENTWADRTLTVARNVHEIKKEYELAIRGIKELTEDKLNDEGMNFKDIITILDETMKKEIKRSGKNIELVLETGGSFHTSKHYYLMSIFRNLIINAIDAISPSDKEPRISFTHRTQEEEHVFIISDNGSGIDEESLKHIFSPGFSTKINYTTGQINRGLGLSVVQDIVEGELMGEITVSSAKGYGTTFQIYIPRISLEVA